MQCSYMGKDIPTKLEEDLGIISFKLLILHLKKLIPRATCVTAKLITSRNR